MTQRARPRPLPRIHAYAASFGEDLASELIQESTEEGSVVLDPFVGAGTTALESVLSNRNVVGIDVDPIACRISRVLTSRFDVQYLVAATEYLQERLRSFEMLLVSEPEVYLDLRPGSSFEIGSWVFQVPGEPAIAYWFDPSHMATLSIIRDMVSCERDPLVRQAFEVAISSSIIRKWPNTLSYAMDIDHSRPHRPHSPRPQSIEAQFTLFYRVLGRVRDSIGLRQAAANNTDEDCLSVIPKLSGPLAPFRDMPIYRTISRYVVDLAAVIDQLHRVVKRRSKVVFVVADNVKAGIVLPVSAIIGHLLENNGFSSVVATGRTIKTTRRRYPFGINGFTGTMTDEYLVTGVK